MLESLITIADIELEVECRANSMTVEMVMLLLDKWEREFNLDDLEGQRKVAVEKAFNGEDFDKLAGLVSGKEPAPDTQE